MFPSTAAVMNIWHGTGTWHSHTSNSFLHMFLPIYTRNSDVENLSKCVVTGKSVTLQISCNPATALHNIVACGRCQSACSRTPMTIRLTMWAYMSVLLFLLGATSGMTQSVEGILERGFVAMEALNNSRQVSINSSFEDGGMVGNNHRSLLGAAAVASTVKVTGDGMWFWFADPRAVYYKGTFERLYTGWVNKAGDVQAGGVDLATGKALGVVTLFKKLQIYEFINPSFLVLNDGRLAAFYSAHNTPPMYFQTTLKPEDISSWTTPKALPSACATCPWSYPLPMRVPGKPKSLSMVARHSDRHMHISYSDDNGGTWTTPLKILIPTGTDGFWKVWRDGSGGLHVAFNDDRPQTAAVNKVYYGYYKGGCWFKASGTKIKCNAPLKAIEADLVYDSSAGRSWIWDVAVTSSGTPVMVFATFPQDNSHVYRYARWTGTAWVHKVVTNAGGWTWTPAVATPPKAKPFYSGGISINKANPSSVYLSKPGPTSRFQVERWSTADNGDTWTRAAVLSSSSRPSIRPFPVVNAPGEMVAWVQIKKYVYVDNYDTSVRLYYKR